ncbi:MAG: BspA family leucine-rich repeat surface protein [Bacteroidota bacterium]
MRGIKCIFFIVLLITGISKLTAQTTDFVTTWKTDNPGNSSNVQITIPTTGDGYNYNVKWGDGNISTGVTGNITHNYLTPGIYTVRISGSFPRIYFNTDGEKQKILTVEQWGSAMHWTSFGHAFQGCSKLIVNATDAPDLSGVTDLMAMFAFCSAFNQPVNHWNTEHITDMSFMFYFATTFNQPVNNWNTGNVTLMHSMFSFASAFDQPIGNWNTGNVTNMISMFGSAVAFNQPIGKWNTSNLNNAISMFQSAKKFDQNIGNWNIGNVLNIDGMLSYSGLSTSNYDSTLIGWYNQPHLKNLYLGAFGLKYCAAATEHSLLVGNDNWTIRDDTLICAANSNIFVFRGNGNWSNIANWINTGVPLNAIPPGSTILIDPMGTGECIVDIPVYIPAGVSVTVAPNKKLLVMGNLIIQ